MGSNSYVQAATFLAEACVSNINHPLEHLDDSSYKTSTLVNFTIDKIEIKDKGVWASGNCYYKLLK